MEKLNEGRFSGKVHSVFRQAVNIIAAEGDLYSLVTEKLDNAPNTLRISISGYEDLTCVGLLPGADVCMKNRTLLIGDTAVDTSGAALWLQSLPAFPAEDGLIRLKQNLDVLRQTISIHGQEGGLKGLVDSRAGAPKDIFARELQERSARLLIALKAKDFSQAYPAGRKLLGLGGGQTPSGDDFCTGLIAVMHLPAGPFDGGFRRFGSYLAAEAKQLTTPISHAMLLCAAEGRVREKIVRLLFAAAQGSQEDAAQAVRQVLEIGSMSGTDLAVGITAGLELGISLRKG